MVLLFPAHCAAQCLPNSPPGKILPPTGKKMPPLPDHIARQSFEPKFSPQKR